MVMLMTEGMEIQDRPSRVRGKLQRRVGIAKIPVWDGRLAGVVWADDGVSGVRRASGRAYCC